jgi:hypothetical protein
MDAFDSIHPMPAQWLRDSVLAPFVPAYLSCGNPQAVSPAEKQNG